MAIEWRSQQTWRGLPLVHVAIGRRQAGVPYRAGRARGVIAVGDRALGIVAVGVVAVGVVAVGVVAVGVVAVRAVAVGLANARGGGRHQRRHRDGALRAAVVAAAVQQ